MMRQRKNLPQPLFRQEFSDWMYKQERWTQEVQDTTLSRLTKPLYDALTNGQLCYEPYDPYKHLDQAIRINRSEKQAREILNEVEELLRLAIKSDTSAPGSESQNVLNNWLAAWKIYSEFIETVILPLI